MSEDEGCYLVYESDSGGKLMLYYSRAKVPNAVGFWRAGEEKKIQGFKFNQNGGRVELIKGIAGGDANKKKYYSGWCQFVKAARSFKGSVAKFPDKGGIEVDLYGYTREGLLLQKLELDDEISDVTAIDAITCVPKHNDCYAGVKNMDISTFLEKGNTKGATISF
mmetsp:Transcript_53036/g.158728  ORF Transcript_53036/g.158728 Transcript_53036/m.158728 type:complete len:165 (-) Transcript_53036:274-768(-)|eukprot:CAMPEP_0113558924 /NCGR_PEP_ID=MMETSP0015_2-20120614/18617_1 /TAXON_ID=2838 /ORGANISM="Odontella" /LENGTH=164 /DNA_ID=CAMNT_0000460515 /DNA_START=84 /DNA_END=578 /DNA_ORIENTATION=- /assembly_acc=CAM_ASM_000160